MWEVSRGAVIPFRLVGLPHTPAWLPKLTECYKVLGGFDPRQQRRFVIERLGIVPVKGLRDPDSLWKNELGCWKIPIVVFVSI